MDQTHIMSVETLSKKQDSPNIETLLANFPLYRNFRGVVEVIKEDSSAIRTTGIFRVCVGGMIIVTELPIGLDRDMYHEWLKNLINEEKITHFNDNSTEDNIHFEIYGFQGHPNFKNLGLGTTLEVNNISKF
ncbi:Hypothetical protein HVR_LOCUS375 [uncultured virus]|nr:Hypothetical protein HVR_LOCUS375 [uncultured virus]